MPLSKGDRLGPYEIVALVGQGGMGEVYRAHDHRLRRDVAIKVSDAQFTARFSVEARSIAALNHTNICHLYDVGPNYLVMEYVEGEDLAGPLDFNEAQPIIEQLIDGIEAAHEKNIVHRDLKPANIKITPDGVVKILDFGLAKAMDSTPPGGSNAENSPTLTIGATAVGTILGTAGYMAPEQAKGKQADKRSDIWSFGVILFELLTGKKMFSGETAVEILGEVLNKAPDIRAAPARVHRLLRWCLEKDRKLRLSSISDARRLLSEVEPAAALPAPQATGGWLWPAVAAIALVCAAALGVALWRATRPVDRPLVRTTLDVPGYSIDSSGSANLALSLDGTRIAYVTGGKDGVQRLATRLLAESDAKILTGTEGASRPFFSPDGQWIGFGAGGQLKKVPALGGAPLKLADAPLLLGGSWSENGFIVAEVNAGSSLMRIQESGGAVEALLPPAAESTLFPQVLPGGKKLIYGGRDAEGPAVKILSLETKKVSTLIPGAPWARYLPTGGASGHIVYLNGSTLMAARFDPAVGEIRGQAIPVLDGVAGEISFSAGGDVLYPAGAAPDTSNWPLRWLRPDGTTEPLLESRGDYTFPRVSPDGRLLALTLNSDRSAETRLLVYDWRSDRTLPLTEKGQVIAGAVWTPDSRYLIWAAPSAGGKTRFLWKRSDGSGEVHTLVESATYINPLAISPDGKHLALEANGGRATILDVLVAPLDLSRPDEMKLGEAEPLVRTPAIEAGAVFSPDGKWVAYFSDESGQYEVYVQQFPGGGGHRKISDGAGSVYPKWSANGRQLLYHDAAQQRIMAVDYRVNGEAFVASKPKPWTGTPVRQINADDSWGLDPKDERLVIAPMEAAPDKAGPPKVAYLLNFFDEVRRKVPGEK